MRWEERTDYGFFPLSEQWNWYGVDIGLFIVLTWFFDAVLYLKLKPWFMFTRSYWVGAKKKTVQKVGTRLLRKYEFRSIYTNCFLSG